MSKTLLSNIFLLAISMAFFLDAINADALFTSHSMIREEYEGQSSETYDSHSDEQVISRFGTTDNCAYQPANNSTQPIYLIDEDSVSLAAQPTMGEVAGFYLRRSESVLYTNPNVPLLDFCSLCKLQI